MQIQRPLAESDTRHAPLMIAPTFDCHGTAILAFGVPPGPGGLGHHAAHVSAALTPLFPRLRVYKGAARPMPGWIRRYTHLRFLTGQYQYLGDSRTGRWLADELDRHPFELGYFLTQIARESLSRARSRGARTILDNPNGHIRDFRDQLCRESRRWTGSRYLGHPSERMAKRVEEEYRLADSIRVSSRWAKRSLVERGVDAAKVFVVPQIVDVERFTPVERRQPSGPLKLVFVGSFSLGKGFPYLLRAMARLGPSRVSLEMIGATGDRWCRRLLDRLKAGLDVTHAPANPLAAYQRGELFVLPTLHDGFGLVVAEAMACGLPVITTDCCGAAETVQPGESGWLVPAGDEDALAAALDVALSRRDLLREMGRAARRTAERLNDRAANLATFRQAVRDRWPLEAMAG